MFSSFSDICFSIKPRSTENLCSLTGKLLSKIWKTVYGKIFRKPFFKILQTLTPPPPLLALSLFLAQLHCPPLRSRIIAPLAPISNNSQPSGVDLAQQITPRDLSHRKPIEARANMGFGFFFFLPDLVMGCW